MTYSWLSGSTTVNDVQVDRVLRASTRHMPDLSEDLDPWSWGAMGDLGLTWFWAYEEDCQIDGKPMPSWLLNLCIAARKTYGCNWVLLDPDGDVIPELPTYEHP